MAFVDSFSVTQVETIAQTLPSIIHGVGQSDLQPGNKFPIGAVFILKGWVQPPLIGSDMGCGIAWYNTTVSRCGDREEKRREMKLRFWVVCEDRQRVREEAREVGCR